MNNLSSLESLYKEYYSTYANEIEQELPLRRAAAVKRHKIMNIYYLSREYHWVDLLQEGFYED